MWKEPKRQVFLFVLLTYLSSWALALPALFGGMAQGDLTGAALDVEALLRLAPLALYMWMPAACSLIARRAAGRSLRDGMLRLRLKGNGRIYLLAWLAPFGFAAAGTALYFSLFPGRFDGGLVHLRAALGQMGLTFPDRLGTVAVLGLLAAVLFLAAPLASIVSGPVGEEIGWRGYLFPTLCQCTTPRKAILASGLIWGVWHTPLIVMGWDYGTGYPGYPAAGAAVLTLCCISLGAFLSFLTARTKSVWPAALSHSGINLIFSVYLLGNNFCVGDFHPLLGVHPLTLAGGWLLLAVGWFIWARAGRIFEDSRFPS